jgi:ribosomal protein S18 acetylase RimI-like enzyme
VNALDNEARFSSDRATQPLRLRSLVWATDIDVLPADRVVEGRDDYLVVRSPSNPGHYWGNLLVFSSPPVRGDAGRWERLFELECAREQREPVAHRTFVWDRVDGALGCARDEFVARGYDLEEMVGLVATTKHLRPHPRENRDVVIRSLDPRDDAEEELWEQVVELQVAARDARFEEQTYREFCRRRLRELRALFRAGRGAWYVATEPGGSEALASCGVVVSGRCGRFQAVDTAAAHQRRGICSRLVVEAAHHTAERYRAARFVIVADPNYHALGLYESLGFVRAERVAGVCRRPDRS